MIRIVLSERGALDTYVSFPFRLGITFPTALAAPVELGMMFPLIPRPPRQSLFEGPSTVYEKRIRLARSNMFEVK
jgi:hypothetical protein